MKIKAKTISSPETEVFPNLEVSQQTRCEECVWKSQGGTQLLMKETGETTEGAAGGHRAESIFAKFCRGNTWRGFSKEQDC